MYPGQDVTQDSLMTSVTETQRDCGLIRDALDKTLTSL